MFQWLCVICQNVVFDKYHVACRHVIEKHSHFMYQCNKCRKVFTRRCYNHNACRNLQSKDFDLMSPDGTRENAAQQLFEWKKKKLPNLVKSVEVGYLRNIRLLKEEYGPTSVDIDNHLSVENKQSEDIDDMFKIVTPISPITSPKRKIVVTETKHLEDISEEELDFNDDVTNDKVEVDKNADTESMNSSSSSDDSSSVTTSSSSTSSSSSSCSTKSLRKRKRTWNKFKESQCSDSETETSVKSEKKKVKIEECNKSSKEK